MIHHFIEQLKTLDYEYIGLNIAGGSMAVINFVSENTNYNIGILVSASVIILNLSKAYKYIKSTKKGNICKIDKEDKKKEK